MNKKITTLASYLLIASVISIWWFFAFRDKPKITKQIVSTQKKEKPKFYEQLSPFDRNQIQQALAGNFALMAKLIVEWDVDAELLEQNGFNIKRLSRQNYLKSQLIARQIKNGKKSTRKYLPQTYVSATFLLALLDPGQIVGLPQGFRKQPLFSQELYNKIPLDLDRYHSEKIFREKPDLAFVANYSTPSTVQALQNQGIELFTLNAFDTIPEIATSLQHLGEAIDRSDEAELLTLFMESALLAIDNRLTAVHDRYSDKAPHILFMNYHAQFSVPAMRTLTGHLLQRLMEHKIVFLFEKSPIDQEKIVSCNPEFLLIATSDAKAINTNLPFNIHYLDDNIQQSNTQYIVLAYFDLAHAVLAPYGGL